jgi:hypothetical protein
MQPRVALRWWIILGAFWGIALAVRTAQARSCAGTGDCPTGFVCVPDGTAADGGGAGLCASVDCQSDSDCGPALRCDFDVGTICTTGSDDASSCVADNACVPQWQAPCLTDGDCGPGFACSGSDSIYDCGPSPYDAAVPPYATATSVPCADVPMPASPACDADAQANACPRMPAICDAASSCLAVTWKTCVAPPTISCTADSDCPSTWTCQCPNDLSVATVANGPAILADADVGPSDSDVTPSDSACAAVCAPPNADLSLGYGIINGGNANAPAALAGAADASATPAATTGTARTPGEQAAGNTTGGCQLAFGVAQAGLAHGATLSIFGLGLACLRSCRRAQRLRRLGGKYSPTPKPAA